MVKTTDNPMIASLFSEQKFWDLAIVYVKGKPPIGMEPDVNLKMLPDGKMIKMSSVVPHPSPQGQEDLRKQFTLISYISVSEIYAIDYYTENRIATSGSMKTIPE